MVSTTSLSRPSTAAMVDGCNSQASCMALARALTSASPSPKLSDPAATSALNSPRLCPATMSGWKRSPKHSAKTTEWMKIAGWVTLVCLRASGVPSNMVEAMSKPNTSLASAKRRLAKSDWSNRSFPMPGNWAPWPGNTNAFMRFRKISATNLPQEFVSAAPPGPHRRGPQECRGWAHAARVPHPCRKSRSSPAWWTTNC